MRQTDYADTIRRYYAAWEADDIDGVLALCTDDVIGGVMPGRDLKGKAEVVHFLREFGTGITDKRYEINAIVIDGDLGMIEGVETFTKHGNRVTTPFMAVFRFRDGLIASWRDYFDMASVTKQLQG